MSDKSPATTQTVTISAAPFSGQAGPYGYPMAPQAAQPPSGSDDWTRWSNFVLMELRRLNDCVVSYATEQQKVQVELAKLSIKASIWGLLGGVLAALAAILLKAVGQG